MRSSLPTEGIHPSVTTTASSKIALSDGTLKRNQGSSGSNDLPNAPHQNVRVHFPSFLAGIVLSLGVLFYVPACVPPANAGFGPSFGATTSPPPGLTTPNVQSQDLIGGTTANKKLKVRIGSSIDDRRLQEFSQQLDDIIEELKDRQAMTGTDFEAQKPSPDTASDAGKSPLLSSEVPSEELEKAQLLRTQVFDREQLLEKLEAQPYWFNYLAAFLGSVCSTLVMHPVDTYKTRRQLASASESAAFSTLDGETDEQENVIFLYSEDHPDSLHRGGYKQHDHGEPIAQQKDTAREFLSLYEGLTGNIWKEGPPSALYLGVYETVKSSLLRQIVDPKYLLFVYLLAGAAGEMVGSVVRAPAEAVKTLVQSKAADSALEAAQRVLGTPEGRQNALRAWSASVTRDVPFGAIQLAVFELVKSGILNNPNIDFDSSTLSSEAIIGAFAGGCGAIITSPADVITTRIITQRTDVVEYDVAEGYADYSLAGDGTNTTKIFQQQKPLGVIEMGLKIYREEGLGAFFTGWSARVGYWAPAISIFLTCYCSVRQLGVKYDIFGS